MGSTGEHFTVAETLLVTTAIFSLLVSVAIEVIMFHMSREISARVSSNTGPPLTLPRIPCSHVLQAKRWLRHVLLVILIVNSLLSLSSLVFVIADQASGHGCRHTHAAHATHKAGSTHALYPSWGSDEADPRPDYMQSWTACLRESRSLIASQVSCLLVFAFSVILLASVWLDLRRYGPREQDEEAESFGEKGEIYI